MPNEQAKKCRGANNCQGYYQFPNTCHVFCLIFPFLFFVLQWNASTVLMSHFMIMYEPWVLSCITSQRLSLPLREASVLQHASCWLPTGAFCVIGCVHAFAYFCSAASLCCLLVCWMRVSREKLPLVLILARAQTFWMRHKVRWL